MFNKQFFAAASACTLVISAIPSIAVAQQTTKDGVRSENAVNRPERPYRPAGSSDKRDRCHMAARGFGKRDRRLVYVSLPGGTACGQLSSAQYGVCIAVLGGRRDVESVTRTPRRTVR